VIDSHCHLAGPEFVDDLADVIARAKHAGLERVLVILAAEDDEEIARAGRVIDLWPEARVAVGVHPHTAHQHAADPDSVATLVARRLALLPSVRAIGEIGLDYHYDFSPRDVQQAVFRAQLRLARERRLPVVLHVRQAEDDTLRILEEEGAGRGLRGVFHCFTGDAAAARRALGTGFSVSIPGIVTFPKGGVLREAVSVVPDDRLLIETDSPYLAPIPHRGTRNEPAFVARTFETVAELRGVESARLAALLRMNFDALFEKQ
jgi:TatD DNase family protein